MRPHAPLLILLIALAAFVTLVSLRGIWQIETAPTPIGVPLQCRLTPERQRGLSLSL